MSNVRQPRAWSNPVLLPTWTLYVCVHAGATVTRSGRGGQLGHVLIFFFQIFFFQRSLESGLDRLKNILYMNKASPAKWVLIWSKGPGGQLVAWPS